MPDKKKITYILGAGATQAEVDLKDPAIRVLMRDIKDAMQIRIREDNIIPLLSVLNELADDAIDVEHLITLYESSGSPSHVDIARLLRKLFREAIQKKLGHLGDDFTPKLISALLDMHEIEALNEELHGILTLNYDGFIESAVDNFLGGIDYGIMINCRHSKLRSADEAPFPLLKLHGSFNWKNEFPVCLIDERELAAGEEHLWIPPGVEKKRERYPFSLLWGLAREILFCDVVRVIGCSLSRNDWELISMVYATQNLTALDKRYDIEVIDYIEPGKKIKDNYGYLKIKTIVDLEEVREYLAQLFEIKDRNFIPDAVRDILSQSNAKMNIFDFWLKAKGVAITKSGGTVRTTKNYFSAVVDEAAL